MAQLLLSISEGLVTFGGDKPVFDNINLVINEGDKICLVGKNGAGKSTLISVITDERELDDGKRWSAPNIRIGYLRQDIDVAKLIKEFGNLSVKDYVFTGLVEKEQTADNEYMVDIAIAPLGLDREAKISDLSGGQLRRAGLARALISEPDILLLDEPTNHMDLDAIEWLESYLKGYKGALICISHDRAFLKAISSKVFWLDRGSIRVLTKGYEFFEDWAADCKEQEMREIVNAQKKMERENEWLHGGGITARRKRNVKRLANLVALRTKLKADKSSYNQTFNTVKLEPMDAVLRSKIILEIKELNFAYEPKKPMVKDLNLRIIRGEKIGIIGANGSGKTTFLQLLTKKLTPDTGRIKLAKNAEISYFDQKRSDLDPKKTLWKTLAEDGDYVNVRGKSRHVVAYLKDFMFKPEEAHSKVSTLSGGQQNRLLLAKILANPTDFLILDEPTNDLDIETLDALQEVIADYAGTLLIVSHDRDFLDRTVSKIIAFEGEGEINGYIGGYSDYIEAKEKSQSSHSRESGNLKKDKAEDPRLRGDDSSKGKDKKISYKFIHEHEKLPKKIQCLENEIKDLTALLQDSNLYMDDKEKFDESTARLVNANKELEQDEHRWLELEEMINS